MFTIALVLPQGFISKNTVPETFFGWEFVAGIEETEAGKDSL
jgi:hypothetical protein